MGRNAGQEEKGNINIEYIYIYIYIIIIIIIILYPSSPLFVFQVLHHYTILIILFFSLCPAIRKGRRIAPTPFLFLPFCPAPRALVCRDGFPVPDFVYYLLRGFFRVIRASSDVFRMP